MNQAVNSLVIDLLKSPLILILVIIGILGIIFRIIIFIKDVKKKVGSSMTNEGKVEEKICPKCGGKMLLRRGKYGQFYGCSNYPECKYTEKI